MIDKPYMPNKSMRANRTYGAISIHRAFTLIVAILLSLTATLAQDPSTPTPDPSTPTPDPSTPSVTRSTGVQISIGGNVYGGGNEGEVHDSTSVTIRNGTISNVFGGGRMANVGGHAFVNLDGAGASSTSRILIGNVYGGNDISGTVGVNIPLNESGRDKVPAKLTDVLRGTETLTDHPEKNDINNSWSAFVRSSEMKDKTTDVNNESFEHAILVGSIYGGGNGDYTYDSEDDVPAAGQTTHYIKDKLTNEIIATTVTPTGGAGFTEPELAKAYLEINGGCLSQVYGGGNLATVTDNTVISMDNHSKGLQELIPAQNQGESDAAYQARLLAILYQLADFTGLSTFQGDFSSLNYTSSRVFGGNNLATMSIHPHWNLKNGKIRDLYSGGNEGDMTNSYGLLLEIPERSNISVINVYGGCRRANVHPLLNGSEVGSADVQLPTALGYHFPAGLSARVLVHGGDVTNVYGGNDISGRVWGGTAVGIRTSIRGDVYGGGNGSYAYTNNPALKNDPNYKDFYFDVPDGKTTVEALNDHRPHVEQTSLRLWGESPEHRTIIGGSVYVGGNSATVIENPTLTNPIIELKIGSNVIADNVFLGNNGVQMIGASAENVLQIYKSTVQDRNGNSQQYTLNFDLENAVTVAKYMDGCAMSLHPRIVFDNTENGDPDTYVPYSSYFGSFFCGGNVGSMTWSGTTTIDVDDPIIIYDKFVTGCNNAFMPDIPGLSDVYWGGLTGSSAEMQEHGMENTDGTIKDAVIMNLSGLKVQPKRWVTKRDANYDPVLSAEGKPIYLATDGCELATINAVCEHGKQPYLEWNTFDERTGKDVANPAELASGATRNSDADDVNRRLKGGNIYGGCYAAGFVNGNVVFNINESIMDRDEVFARVQEDDEGEGIYYNNTEYHITKVNSGVIIDEQGMDVLGKAMNIFGGGYGAGTEIWGSTTINLKQGYTFQVFGGAEKGIIGIPVTTYTNGVAEYPTTTDPDGTIDWTNGTYAFNGYLYHIDERCSTYINLDGAFAGVSRHSTDDTEEMAETEFIYGGGFVGPIMGSTNVYLGNGRIFNSFAGSCNADIMGHTETYVGLNAAGKAGFPFIRDHIYGGNDLGGKIYGSKNFTDRIREDVTGIKDNIYDKDHSPVASAYVEYQQGRVDYIFGGCYGTYDYTDPEYAEYFYTTGGNGTISDPTNPNFNLGKARPGYSKPYLGNAFVNFRPVVSSNPLDKAKRVYGAGQGITGEKEIDVMQDRSYVLIDIPQTMTEFHDLVVFGAGSSCGLGMNAPAYAPEAPVATDPGASGTDAEKEAYQAYQRYQAYQAYLANPDAYSAVIDLFRGDISEGNVYGGSYTEGVTRRTIVNVPSVSTVKGKNIFGGAYGVTNERPCDVYEAIVNYNSDNAQMTGSIYGGNNAFRRTFYGKVNISSPVWSNKANGYTATVYGAGYGEDTWSQYTEVNLLNGASVYEAYGGGQKGKVMNLESVNAWKAKLELLGQSLYTDISPDPNSLYEDLGLASNVANYNELENDLANTAHIVNREDSWKNIGTTYTKKKYNTNVSIKEGATVGGYCYGGGLGYNDTPTSGDVYGTTYIELVGGTVVKDLYGAGTTGAVMDGMKVAKDNNSNNDFIASANVYIKGGTARNVYGGGWEGPVGYHDESTTTTTTDILGETHVVIGVLGGPCTPTPALTYTNGIPTVQRNAYGGGEGGVIYGTANITVNNGYIGYVYNASGSDVASTDDFDEHYEEKIADETYDDGNGAGNNQRLVRAGNLFGSGYADYSNADFTNVYLYGGNVRGGAYGGGEIGTVGRGSNSNGNVTIHKPGESHLFMYQGHVMQDVFGGGRGFDNLNRVSAIGTGGYVFGLTDVNIFGGEVGTVAGVANGYGNVFGGGNLGYVYSGLGTKNTTDGYYYNNSTGLLTEDCRVIVAPACQVLCGESITLNRHTYTAGQYVPAEDLNFLLNKNAGGSDWAKVDASDNHSGVTIRNAVFAGGNVSSGSDQVYVNTVTVYGNASATLYDIYNRDLITIGTEHVGGLYGDGNLTFVDGYRELNVSNYGTDFYGLSDNISLDDYYNKLTDRERAYFTLEYKCLEGYHSDALGKTFNAGERIKEDDFKLITDPDEQHKWELLGFCTIYAGRLLNTLQRADFVGVFGSRMVLQGAQDRVPEVVDYTNYTINRVGELSLNKCDSQAGDTGENASHGSYFGIYSIVNYLGALTSDVDFTEVRTTDNTEAQYQPDTDTPGQTYQQWKERHINERKRNNGSCHNKVALASGVYLELTTEESTANNKVWGLVTGVCQLDLISVVPGIGGGYVYAKNEHGTRQASGNNQTILSPYNMAGYGHARAVTNKIYTYDSSLKPYETSGNFIHNLKQIIDDCYPTSGSYSGPDAAPAHYWYIRGEIYVYDQYISAYTGSASAYAESINLPLTITPASNGVLELQDVKENLYAYYDNTTPGSETKIGENGILLGTTTYHLNDPITYWDYYLLSAEERKHFVKKTYTIVEKCKIGGVEYNVGDAMLAGDCPSSSEEALVWVGNEWKQVEGKNVDYLVRQTNNVAHNTGYALTYDMSNPKVWDRYYTPPTGASLADNVRDKLTTTAYNANPSSYSTYIAAPTYTPTTSGVYGQRDYEVGDIIPSDIHTKYEAIGAGNHSYPSGQATVARAYVATDEVTYTIGTGTEAVEHHVYKGYAIPETEYDQMDASTQAKFQTANVCTSTIELGNNEYVYYGDLLTDAEMATAKTAYKTFLMSQGISDTAAATKADADFATSVLNAYYCTEAGKYGGDYYEASHNYRAVEAWSSMSETDRANFTFNYDAFDTLIDPDFAGDPTEYDGYDSNNTLLQELYSALTPVDYKATYNEQNTDLTYTDENNATKTVTAGATIEREVFEDIPNEKRFYQAFTINTTGLHYIVKVPFTRGETPYTVGTVLSQSIYEGLDTDQKQYVMQQTFTSDGTYYFCRKPYIINAKGEGYAFTDINSESHALGSEVTVGTIITSGVYEQLPNKQVNFTIHGDVPVGTSTLYVSRESDINDLSKDKVITVIYQYTFEESDESGTHIEEITEKHVINIHLQFKSGVPSISELEKPAIVLPNSTVGLKQPNVTPGAFEIIGGGWEMFTNQTDAEHHTNGIPYFNNLTPMYWYQNDYYVAYYAKSYLGKTYSNAVQFTVANYHDLDAVMNHERHLFVDHEDVDRPCKIYIDNRECTDNTKSELDLLKDFFDLTLHNTMDDGNPTLINDGSSVNGHKTVNDHIRGGANLEFFLKSDVEPKAYTTWEPIGDASQCFEGVVHGNGYTISGLSNSLFGSLCGDVYNLGVTGSFTSAGIVDTGSGYVENCWISTTGTPASGVHAVFNDPNRDPALNMPVQVVNCYYPADNAYDETPHSDNHGDAIKKPRQSFYNGEVAYDLNGFYLNKRYNDHLSSIPTGYSYDGTHNFYKYWDADDLDTNNKPLLKQGGYEAETNYTLGYVEEYYKDGDFIYAGGSIPEGDNERYAATEGKFYPIWPDDYIFFGQMLTYGHVDSRPHQDLPAHINKSGDRLTITATSVNRVYRAPAYFRNSTMGVAYYNPYAVFAAKSYDNSHTAYPNMTAVDFTGGNGDLTGTTTTPAPVNGNPYKKGLCAPVTTSEAVFYPPLLDNDGLTYFRNVDLTRNLLVYTPASTGDENDANTKTNAAVMAALAEPVYTEGNATGTGYVAGKAEYRTVAAQDATTIHGHAVVETAAGTYTATNDHFLVDKNDFNAPISYTFATGKRMWHQRTPDTYVDRVKGWEAISLPFEVELVTTQQKGEITHFYQDNTIGHEYWLREFNTGTGTTENNVYKGIFNYPAKGSTDKEYTNTFLWDYYYQELGVVRPDANEDKYDWAYYSTTQTHEDYPYAVAAKPYIIGFPGTTYYEFDLSGNFEAANTLRSVTKLRKQVITFASPTEITIRVSDTETMTSGTNFGGVTNVDGYTFHPSYLNESFDSGTSTFTLKSNYDSDSDTNADCSSFVKVPATGDATTVSAFRPYFTYTAPSRRAASEVTEITFGFSTGIDEELTPWMGDLSAGLAIYARPGKIVVESHRTTEAPVRILTPAGLTITTFTIQPGETIETRIHATGVYIANGKKLRVESR